MRFELATAARVVFGPGSLAELGEVASALGSSRAARHRRRSPSAPPRARERLAVAGLAVDAFAIASEPTVDDVRRGVEAGRAAGADVVVACGGGSAIDGGQGDRRAPRQRRRPARLPRGRRPRAAARAAVAAVRGRPDHGRHRLRGDAQRRPRLARAPRRRRACAARACCRRRPSWTPTCSSACRRTSWRRAGSTRSRSSSSRSSRSAPTRSSTRSPARASLARRARSGARTRATRTRAGADGPRAREPLRRPRPRQRGPRGGPRHRGAVRRALRGAARRGVRGSPPGRDAREPRARSPRERRTARRSTATARSPRS